MKHNKQQSENQKYNKTITFKPLLNPKSTSFDLCYLTYNGKLTHIVEHFNKLKAPAAYEIISTSFDEAKRNALQMCAFLNFANIFLYLLTYDNQQSTPLIDEHSDNNIQSTWHMLAYKGHTKLLALLLNHIRYTLKMSTIETIDNIKKSSGFSNLDIVKGKLSRAVHKTAKNEEKFKQLQDKIRNAGKALIEGFITKLYNALKLQDKVGQTPLHLAAMSKFPLSHLICYMILEFDFFKYDETWDEYLNIYEDLQALEIKPERLVDPRRSLRLERELITLLGDDVIKKELSPLFMKKKKEMLKELINLPDKNGDSVLHISAFHGDFRIVNKLVLFGGNKKQTNEKNKLPVDMAKDNFVRKVLTDLNKAAKESDSKNIEELVNFGQDINEKISIFSQAPIHKVIEGNIKTTNNKKDKEETLAKQKENKEKVLREMLDMGADPNIRDSNGWSALHYACQLGDLNSVQILLEKNAEIDSYSNNKRIPLHLAANMNYPDIVKCLLEKNSNPNYKDNTGCTPLHLAAKQGNTKCIEYLLQNNAYLYSVDFRGWSILHYAAFHGHKETVRFICKYDADNDILRNQRNSQNKLPIEIVRDPSVKPYFISLWHAAKEGDLDMTTNLINDGENVDEQSHFFQNTPLHLAVLNNHYLLVKLLQKQNAKEDLKNNDNKEPWEYALEMSQPIRDRYQFAEDKNRDVLDLRDVVRMDETMDKKGEKVINATICKKNWSVRVWNAFDFNVKIQEILKAQDKAKDKIEDSKGDGNEQQRKEQNGNNNNNENKQSNNEVQDEDEEYNFKDNDKLSDNKDNNDGMGFDEQI